MNEQTAIDRLADGITDFAMQRRVLVSVVMAATTLLLIALAALPSVWPDRFAMLHPVAIDTDPENMLAHDEPVRQFHDQAKQRFGLYDMVVVGVVNETDPDGVFNPDSLGRIHALTEFAMTLKYPDPRHPEQRREVVGVDVIAPSNVDDIQQAGPGQVKFSWLMPSPPKTRAEAQEILERARRIPMLDGTLTGADGRALALYLPITSKAISWNVRRDILEFTADWPAADQVHVTGLPVAEDTFGVEMFKQMAISAPLAMLVIFGLMLAFFRNLTLVISPMIVAMVSALSTMALLVVTGNTIHIMSSMIPIFIMPIAVLDSVHILSEAFDRHQQSGDRAQTIRRVMRELFRPMLFTSLTTTAGFASLALTPIPPVQVFGVFVAIGVMLAWLWSVLFIPAWFMFIPEYKLAGFGHAAGDPGDDSGDDPGAATWLGRGLGVVGRFATGRSRLVLAAAVVLAGIAALGIARIQINDNPIKWFEPAHPIRVADRVMNEHLAGTYMAYLELEPNRDESLVSIRQAVVEALQAEDGAAFEQAARLAGATDAETPAGYFDELLAAIERASLEAEDPFAWDEVWNVVDRQRALRETFKNPELLRWMERLQMALAEDEHVGKVNGLTDVVKTVHRELLGGGSEAFRIPDRAATVAQTLLTYQSSHRPQDLWHFVTPDFRAANLWVQLSSGDNRDMERVVARAERFIEANPPPQSLAANWFGLTYINVVWQDKMVNGMLVAFLGSFVIVLAMMVVLFRSLLWGLLSMIPLTLTVALIYGVIGIIGKDYDMPVAVLSALSLGLAVDFAIHLLARARQIHADCGHWSETASRLFGEPARAISRNTIILGAGFLPLLAAPLVPYQTVGIFIAAIIVAAGIITLVLLPAMIGMMYPLLFRNTMSPD